MVTPGVCFKTSLDIMVTPNDESAYAALRIYVYVYIQHYPAFSGLLRCLPIPWVISTREIGNHHYVVYLLSPPLRLGTLTLTYTPRSHIVQVSWSWNRFLGDDGWKDHWITSAMLFAIVYPPQDSFVSPNNMVFGCLWRPRDMNSGGGLHLLFWRRPAWFPLWWKQHPF